MKNKKLNISMIDMKVISLIFGDNLIATQEYIKKFIKITSVLLKKVGDAIHQENSKLALDYFHQLKGPIGSIGFKKMYQLCEKTEKKIIQCDWSEAYESYHEIEKILKKLQAECDKKFKN